MKNDKARSEYVWLASVIDSCKTSGQLQVAIRLVKRWQKIQSRRFSLSILAFDEAIRKPKELINMAETMLEELQAQEEMLYGY